MGGRLWLAVGLTAAALVAVNLWVPVVVYGSLGPQQYSDDWFRADAWIWDALGAGYPMGRGRLPVQVRWASAIQRAILVAAFGGALVALMATPGGETRRRLPLALSIALLGVALWPTTVWLPCYHFNDDSGLPGRWSAQRENLSVADVRWRDVRFLRGVEYRAPAPPREFVVDGVRVRVHAGTRIHWPLVFGAQALILLFGGALLGWMIWRERRLRALDPDPATSPP